MINLKGFVDFDCQGTFLKNEGMKALFNISALLEKSD